MCKITNSHETYSEDNLDIKSEWVRDSSLSKYEIVIKKKQKKRWMKKHKNKEDCEKMKIKS